MGEHFCYKIIYGREMVFIAGSFAALALIFGLFVALCRFLRILVLQNKKLICLWSICMKSLIKVSSWKWLDHNICFPLITKSKNKKSLPGYLFVISAFMLLILEHWFAFKQFWSSFLNLGKYFFYIGWKLWSEWISTPIDKIPRKILSRIISMIQLIKKQQFRNAVVKY